MEESPREIAELRRDRFHQEFKDTLLNRSGNRPREFLVALATTAHTATRLAKDHLHGDPFDLRLSESRVGWKKSEEGRFEEVDEFLVAAAASSLRLPPGAPRTCGRHILRSGHSVNRRAVKAR